MAETSIFSPREAAFLQRHNISCDEIYDGRGQSKRWREDAARDLGLSFIFCDVVGRNLCRTYNHRLRTRSGHCIQCKPTNIAYQRREDTPGYVYIAGSLRERVIKIGTTGNLNQRHKQMRAEGYGGSSDWVILFSVKVEKGGEFERSAASLVNGNRVYRPYFKDGIEQNAVELFECPYSEALKAVTMFLSDDQKRDAWESIYKDGYEFEYK